MNKPLRVTLLALILNALALPLAVAEIRLEFKTRVEIALCPEYPLAEGGVVLDIAYTVGDSTTPITADVISMDVDEDNNTATVDLRFPSTYGTAPLHVVAFCRNAFGFSDPSNEKVVSNCDSLARYDDDNDGIPNNLEDVNCDNFYSPGDISNPENADTDGDGVRDLVEIFAQKDPSNPGDSPFPFVFSAAPFDPDNDDNSNPVVWRSSEGLWYVKDFVEEDNHLVFPYGIPGDIPFIYEPDNMQSNVGVIRRSGNEYVWYFRGEGFKMSDETFVTVLPFGIFGDNIILGPWETPGITNPAVARLFNNIWTFSIYMSDGSVKLVNWGGNGDLPKVDDYDGDGIFDVAVVRPSTQELYVIQSTDGLGKVYPYGTITGDHTVRGDYTGDGISEITQWEPLSGMFESWTSDSGFDPMNTFEMQLGLYNVHLPLNWNFQNGQLLYTVVEHATMLRYNRENNDPSGNFEVTQWGLGGDHVQ